MDSIVGEIDKKRLFMGLALTLFSMTGALAAAGPVIGSTISGRILDSGGRSPGPVPIRIEPATSRCSSAVQVGAAMRLRTTPAGRYSVEVEPIALRLVAQVEEREVAIAVPPTFYPERSAPLRLPDLQTYEIAAYDSTGAVLPGIEIRSSGVDFGKGLRLLPVSRLTDVRLGTASLPLHALESLQVVGHEVEHQEISGRQMTLRVEPQPIPSGFDGETGFEAGAYRVRVLDAQNRVLPGAYAWSRHDPSCFAVSDADGWLQITGETRQELLVAAAGHGLAQVRFQEGLRKQTVSLTTSSTVIGGTVLDPDGAPLEDVRVEIRELWRTSFSGPEGRFLIRGLPLQPTALIRFDKTGFVPLEQSSLLVSLPELESIMATEPQDGWTLSRWSTAQGRVVDRRGMPISEISVSLADADTSFKTDENGRFRVRSIPPGKQLLHFSNDAETLGLTEVIAEPTGGMLDIGTFEIGDTTEISGRVIDQDDQPVVDAAVHLGLHGRFQPPRAHQPNSGLSGYPVITHTDTTGFFHITGLPTAFMATVGVTKPGFAPNAVPVEATEGNSELELRMARMVPLSLRFISSLDGSGIPRIHVTTSPDIPATMGELSSSGWTDDDGTVAVLAFPGRIARIFTWPGHLYADLGISVPRYVGIERVLTPDEIDLGDEITIELQPESLVSGVIRTRDGRPAASVRLRPLASAGMPVASVATSDAEGRFRLEGLIPGRYRYFLTSREVGHHERTLDVLPGENEIELVLDSQLYHLSGEVVLAGGELPSDLVLAAAPDGAFQEGWIAACDRSGSFSFGELPRGRYHIASQTPGYEVIEGGTLDLDDHRQVWRVRLAKSLGTP